MKCTAIVSVTEDIDNLYKVISPESKKWDRSSFKLQKSKGELKFIVTAQDSVALRATLTSITQLLTVYEKVKKID